MKELIKKLLPDELFLKITFWRRMGYRLDLKNPRTFNEKLQWIKLNNKNPLYTRMVDKYESKKYVENLIGSKYIIETLGVYDCFDDIDFESLPNEFVIKCTHDSGTYQIVTNKYELKKELVKERFDKAIKENYFYRGREFPYKNVKPRIIVEKYMTNGVDQKEFTDYKFFAFNGYVDCVMVCLDRASGDTKFYFFDDEWNLKRINKRGKAAPEGFTIPKPDCMDEMFEIASKLSEGIPFVRVDLYQSDGKVYFGELTFFPQSGFDPNLLPETDLYLGKLIDLKIANIEN